MYFVDASVAISKVLTCERKVNKVHNKYAIAINIEGQVFLGHVPVELSKIGSWVIMGILGEGGV